MTNKRVLSGLAAIVMLLSGTALTIVSYAESSATDTAEKQDGQYKESDDYFYEENGDGSVTIAKYKGSDENVVIPDTIDGMTVTAIGDFYDSQDSSGTESSGALGVRMGAFEGNTEIKSVVIPDSVTKIAASAFDSCEKLESVTFGKGVKTIGDFAFIDCSNLKSVVLPENIEEIGNKAFGYAMNPNYDNFTVYCTPDSAAESYAKENGFSFTYTTAVKPTVSSYSSTTNAIRINWDKSEGTTGYVVYRFDDSKNKWEKIATIRNGLTATYRQSGLEAGKTYKYKVKSYVKIDGKNSWSEISSEFIAATKPNKIKVEKTSSAKTAVRLYWDKVSCSGYKIQRYDTTSKSWKTVKLVSAKNTNSRISGLKSGTSYRFRIQAYQKAGDRKSFGSWSKAVTVSTKK